MNTHSIRSSYDIAIHTIFTSVDPDIKKYLFYVHILTQCKVIFDETLPAIAGVSFTNFKYNLYINPIMFSKLTIPHRIGVLKHEMLHIIDLHLTLRRKDYDNHNWNLATDCAINQLINKDHLPENCVTIENLFTDSNIKIASKMNAEYYYNLIKENEEKLNQCLHFRQV